MSSYLLDIESTIVAIDVGTRVTESAVATTITLDASVLFDEERHELRPDAVAELDELAAQIAAAGATELTVGGHTDALGTDDYNQGLSERRANSVKVHLEQRIDGLTVSAEGFGETQPVAPNENADGEDFPEGRSLNRRVEITYRQ